MFVETISKVVGKESGIKSQLLFGTCTFDFYSSTFIPGNKTPISIVSSERMFVETISKVVGKASGIKYQLSFGTCTFDFYSSTFFTLSLKIFPLWRENLHSAQ